MPEVRMALRDASWYNHPDTSAARPKVYHVVHHGYAAACDALVFLVEFTETSLADVPVHLRCHRKGCAKRWRDNGSS